MSWIWLRRCMINSGLHIIWFHSKSKREVIEHKQGHALQPDFRWADFRLRELANQRRSHLPRGCWSERLRSASSKNDWRRLAISLSLYVKLEGVTSLPGHYGGRLRSVAQSLLDCAADLRRPPSSIPSHRFKRHRTDFNVMTHFNACRTVNHLLRRAQHKKGARSQT